MNIGLLKAYPIIAEQKLRLFNAWQLNRYFTLMLFIQVFQCCNCIHAVLKQFPNKCIGIAIQVLGEQCDHSFQIDLKGIGFFFLHVFLTFSFSLSIE
ncbi:hypothetical protein D3C81_1147850 [compost metagenome]